MILTTVFALAMLQQPAATPPVPLTQSNTTKAEDGDGKPWPPSGVFLAAPGSGVTVPMPLKTPKPKYTRDALKAGITGDVVLEMVVRADGKVGEVRVARSLESGLDREAVKKAKQYRFEPATKDRKPEVGILSDRSEVRP